MQQKNALNASFFILFLILHSPCCASQKKVSILGKMQKQVYSTLSFGKFLISIPVNGAVFISTPPIEAVKYVGKSLKNMGILIGNFSAFESEKFTFFKGNPKVDNHNVVIEAEKKPCPQKLESITHNRSFFNTMIGYIKPVTSTEGQAILDCNIECIDKNYHTVDDTITNTFCEINQNIDEHTAKYSVINLHLNSQIEKLKERIKNLNMAVTNQALDINKKSLESSLLTQKQTEEISTMENPPNLISLQDDEQKILNQENSRLLEELENKIKINSQSIINQELLRQRKEDVKINNTLIENEKTVIKYIKTMPLVDTNEIKTKQKNSSPSNLTNQYLFLSTGFKNKTGQLEYNRLLQLILNINKQTDSCFILPSLIPKITELNKNSKKSEVYTILNKYKTEESNTIFGSNNFKLELAYSAACIKQIINQKTLLPSKIVLNGNSTFDVIIKKLEDI